MTKLKLFLCVYVIAGLLSACATKVSSISKDAIRKLDAEEGYLLIAIDTDVDLKEIEIWGRKNIALTSNDLQAGSNYILIPLPAGDYSIHNIRLNRIYKFADFEPDLWSFKVKKNVISYVGHLNMETFYRKWSVYSRIQLLNKSSVALEYLEQHFSTILSARDVQYSGPGHDDFFAVVGADKTAREQ
ncbi:hypothetical protein [Neptunicella sp. SCSIO 80796]|uniref:hypothetical protein n=1 Tax=Neptunicella plasticusilytica TaxID=3117012 RepID=UPI003A4D81E5